MPIIPFDLTSTLAGATPAEICHNLRSTPSGALSAVGSPVTIATLPGAAAVPGGLFTLSDGSTCVAVHHEGSLKVLVHGEIRQLVELDEPPRCVLPTGADGIVIVPASGVPLVAPSLTGSPARPSISPLPPLSLRCMAMGTVTASIAPVTLKGTYSSTSRTLNDTDRATLDKAMRDAYLRLSDRALLHGRHIQPLLARYRLIGHGGTVIYTSSPVVIGPDCGLQATRTTLTLSGDGMRSMTATQLTATEFSVGFSFISEPDEAWHTAVRAVEILISPQLHPLSALLPGTCSFSSASATSLTMDYLLPGVNPLANPADEGQYLRTCITSIIDNADTAMRPSPRAWTDTLAEIASLHSLASLPATSPSAAALMGVRLSAPHGFSASAVARSGDMVAWGDLRAIPFDGYTLPELSTVTATATAAVPTAVSIAMLDGASVVSRAVMRTLSPVALSPLVLYPSPDACSATLIAGKRATTLPLTPSPCGRWGYYISPTLRPVSFTDTLPGFVVPSADPPVHAYPAAIAAARASAPLSPVAFTVGDAGRVVALLPALRHSSSFTVPAARFYVAGTGGLSSMSLNDRLSRINLNLLDPRPISSAGSITAIPGGIAFVAGGGLFTISGSRAPSLLTRLSSIVTGATPTPSADTACARPTSPSASDEWLLGWDDTHGELWCIPATRADATSPQTETTAVITSPDGSTLYTRSSPPISSVLSTASRLMLIDTSGNILDPTSEEWDNTPLTARHLSAIPCNFKPGAETILNLPVYGHDLRGTITLYAAHATHPGRYPHLPLMTITVKGGDLNHPLVQRVRLPHAHTLILDISLTASSLILS